MKSIRVVVYLECDLEAAWIRELLEVWPAHILYQWLECLTRTNTEEWVTNIDCLVTTFHGINKDNIKSDPDIKS